MFSTDVDALREFVLRLERLGLIDRDRLAASVDRERWELDALLHGESPSDVDGAQRLAVRLYMIACAVEVARA